MLFRRPRLTPWICALVLTAAWSGGCGSEPDQGDGRADQARDAALEAGLEDEVADFLALAARGQTATYRATYPGPDDGTELVVANDPPNRRVDVRADERVIEVRLVLDGEAFRCTREGDGEDLGPCERTDAVVDPPGLFDDRALDELAESLRDRQEDFTFRTITTPIAGVEARCLVTEIREGRERAELGDHGTICVSPEGALLKVEQGAETLEASDYTTDVPGDTFVLPDREP